ncbi:threonylcarbamoyl-AMP synthase [Leucobacter sp. cx-42]|uniref:L-threonylcarbamoyladenylate synthase n=1 Tax=unclassified Leucobacter TaxID=2621730 RepID=UPI00165E1887|nr:threonylcarbamoyl-AMP synthase [Leucobacter sp. cx-42]
MADLFDCSEPSQLLSGVRAARQAIGRGELVVLPTDTVYGVGADAFSPEAVERLLAAKGRGRQSPPPVLIPNTDTLAALAREVTEPLTALADAFWPGALTIITHANPALDWDLGDTGGTVALRIPARDLTIELLRETGPLAVSSANLTGEPAATNADEAKAMLGDSVAVYLEGGVADGLSSTIVDATGLKSDGTGAVRVLRVGAVSPEAISDVLELADVQVVIAKKTQRVAPVAAEAAAETAVEAPADAAAEAPVVRDTPETSATAAVAAGEATES